ncbi:hypothetical protein BSIN_3964 [Burkholderia singularis]|uniref:Uncharacterized protein n=1 Tax=Burkholderia singularis TaxID=1503053 RepID=A0A238H702_9BURK|nr:hypothetical protein BSIN_3964 [Burkholderia singularis]
MPYMRQSGANCVLPRAAWASARFFGAWMQADAPDIAHELCAPANPTN